MLLLKRKNKSGNVENKRKGQHDMSWCSDKNKRLLISCCFSSFFIFSPVSLSCFIYLFICSSIYMSVYLCIFVLIVFSRGGFPKMGVWTECVGPSTSIDHIIVSKQNRSFNKQRQQKAAWQSSRSCSLKITTAMRKHWIRNWIIPCHSIHSL